MAFKPGQYVQPNNRLASLSHVFGFQRKDKQMLNSYLVLATIIALVIVAEWYYLPKQRG